MKVDVYQEGRKAHETSSVCVPLEEFERLDSSQHRLPTAYVDSVEMQEVYCDHAVDSNERSADG